ncbi:uncharacterized protein LOC107269645 [Cephus cinctus]|uniref:Uncharacterized protein LOC107269645 n=1 Tax=Cephus cinctus TaxID=211228 RepID=A0AAJ7FML6_CEPCN|nr:uncharacterized protein LOC107269645 [Cephus cinctus]
MKVFVGLMLCTALALAEPPRYRQQNQQQRQYYIARQQEETFPPPAAAPYAPSGWKPAGPTFDLPQKQVQDSYGAPAEPQQQYEAPAVPQQQYGAPAAPRQRYRASSAPQQQYRAPAAPQQQYGAPAAPQQQYGAPASPQQGYGVPEPQQQYGPPETTTTEEPTTTEFEDSTTTPSPDTEAEPVNSVNDLDEEGEVDGQQQQSGEYYVALPDGRLQRIQYVSRQDVEAMKYFARIRAENVEPLRGPIYAYRPLEKLQFAPSALAVASQKTAESRPEKLQAISAKLELQPADDVAATPVAAQVQYQYDAPSSVIPLAGSPVSSSYTTFTANYQVPATEPRYILTF